MARVYFASPARKKKAEDEWWEGYAVNTGCIGAHPLEFRTYFKDWVCESILCYLFDIELETYT